MSGILMLGTYTPTADYDVATKTYVDVKTSAINRLAPVDYATTPANGNQSLKENDISHKSVLKS